MTYFVYVAC